MFANKSQKLNYWEVFLDLLSLNVAFLIAHSLRFHNIMESDGGSSYRTLLVIVNAVYLLLFFLRAKPSPIVRHDLLDTGLHEARLNYVAFGVIYFGVIVFIQGHGYSRTFHAFFLVFFAFAFFLQRGFLLPFVRHHLAGGNRKIKVVLVGAGQIGRMYLDRIAELKSYYDLVAVLDDDPKKARYFNGQFRGNISRLADVLYTHKVDEVIVTIPLHKKEEIERIIQVSQKSYAMVKVIPGYHRDLSWRKFHVEDFSGMWLFSMTNSRLQLVQYQVSKRAFDILFSFVVLVAVLPLVSLFLIPAIKLSGKGTVFFKQIRRGYHGDEFVCWKFRTMKPMDKKSEAKQATPNDPRMTRIGTFLRKINLDELPQFWNVFRGEMSVVGPRPHMVEHDLLYSQLIENYHVRLYAKPGLTGWAQINGYRGATEDPALMRKRVEHDIWYIENWSPWLDAKIVLLTALRMLKGDPNAY